jgi:hypothetical protein
MKNGRLVGTDRLDIYCGRYRAMDRSGWLRQRLLFDEWVAARKTPVLEKATTEKT